MESRRASEHGGTLPDAQQSANGAEANTATEQIRKK
jgi:hypothetical protein